MASKCSARGSLCRTWGFPRAKSTADQPCLSVWDTSAPRLTRRPTILVFPVQAAMCKAVVPSTVLSFTLAPAWSSRSGDPDVASICGNEQWRYSVKRFCTNVCSEANEERRHDMVLGEHGRVDGCSNREPTAGQCCSGRQVAS